MPCLGSLKLDRSTSDIVQVEELEFKSRLVKTISSGVSRSRRHTDIVTHTKP